MTGAAGALDKRGSNLSPPDGKSAARRLRGRLRRYAGRLLPHEAVSRCGAFATPEQFGGAGVTVKVGAAGASVSGVMFCGSVWQCPACAAKFAAARKTEVRRAVERHRAAGGEVYMLTATVRHARGDGCRQLRRAVSRAWSGCLSGAPWQRWRGRLGLHFVRALEVTHGAHGWHPHLHVLIFMDRPGLDAATFGRWLFGRWAAKAQAEELGECDARAWRFERARSSDDAGEYVAKGFSVDWELTHAHLKRGKGGGRSPFQILLDAMVSGSTRDIGLFQEYAVAFKGARQLTWSKGMKDRYQVDQATDAELAAEVDDEAVPVAVIDPRAYEAAAEAGAVSDLLDAAERSGYLGVWMVMDRLGLVWGVTYPETLTPRVMEVFR